MPKSADTITASTIDTYDDVAAPAVVEELLPPFDPVAEEPMPAHRLARHLSNLLSPPSLSLVTFWLLAGIYAADRQLQVFIICILAQVILPLAFLRMAVSWGWIGDMEISRRAERRLGLPLLGVVYLLGAGLTLVTGVPPAIVTVCFCSIVVLSAIWIVNLFYKASGHVAGVAAYMTVLTLFGGEPLHAGLVTIPIVAWARIRSGAHTLAQTIWGLIIGSLLTWALWAWIYVPYVKA